jgi:hypothetical protein
LVEPTNPPCRSREGRQLVVSVFAFVDTVLLNPVGVLLEVVEVVNAIPDVILDENVAVKQEVI